MPGRILRMALMKEKEEQLFNGQWLQRTEHTTCAAGSSQKDEWGVMPLLRQARPQSCWMDEKGGLIIWTGEKNPFASENTCTFGLKSTDFRWLGAQRCPAQESPQLTCCSRCGSVFHPGEAARGELRWGAPGTGQTELQDVLLLLAAFPPPPAEGLQA